MNSQQRDKKMGSTDAAKGPTCKESPWPKRSAEAFHVTPGMKNAGADVLLGWESMNSDMTFDDDKAEEVFLAMWRVYCQSVS